MLRPYSWVPRIQQTLAWIPTRVLLNFFCRFEVTGAENLAGLRQAIFAVNHSSELDPIVLTAALSPLGRFSPMFYLAAPTAAFSDEKFGWRRHIYTGTFFKAWGAYPAEAGLKDYATALRDHVAILRQGGSMCVFPEGRMSKDGNLHDAHGGVSYLAHATHVPVVPVAIIGLHKLNMRRFFDRRYHLTLVFGKPYNVHERITHPAPEVHHFRTVANELIREIEARLRSAKIQVDGRPK